MLKMTILRKDGRKGARERVRSGGREGSRKGGKERAREGGRGGGSKEGIKKCGNRKGCISMRQLHAMHKRYILIITSLYPFTP